MLPLDWLQYARPKPGQILVRRHEEPEKYGRIIIPLSVRSRMRPPFATIVAMADDIDPRWGFQVGDVIALNPVAGVRVLFGRRSEQTYLYPIPPNWVVCGVHPDWQSEMVEDKGESPFRLPGRDPRESMTVEGRRDHGRFKAGG